MRKITIILFIAIFFVPVLHEMSYAFAQGDQNCSKCHTLSNEQATKTLSEMIPNVKVLDITPSSIKGLWEISIEVSGRKAIIYLDYAITHLFSSQATRGDIIDIKTRANLTQEKMQELTKIDVSQVPLEDALVMGDKNAKYKVIVLDDPD